MNETSHSSTASTSNKPRAASTIPAFEPGAARNPLEPGKRPRLPGRLSRLPELAGPGFLPLGLFARLPLAMLTVGTLTLVTAVSTSYAAGGMAAAAVGIGSALGAPMLGAWADRSGQRPVLLLSAIANTLAVLGLLASCFLVPGLSNPAAAWPVLAVALAAGATCPQVGPMARVRWMALTTRSLAPGAQGEGVPASRVSARADLDTALSYEGTADEITFVLGPALVGALASMVAPWLPLALAAALTATLVPAFANHPSHLAVAPVAHDPHAAVGSSMEQRPGALAWLRVAVPVLAMVCMGTFFGATQNGLNAFAAQVATAELAGLLYAVMGLSSAVAALSVAFWPRRFGMGARWLSAAGAMLVFTGLLFPVSDLGPMVAVLLVLGIPVGPVMVTVFAAGGVVAPPGRMATVMTALASGIVAGTALGSFLAGHLAQVHGHAAAFLAASAAAAVLLVLGAVALGILPRERSLAGDRSETEVAEAAV